MGQNQRTITLAICGVLLLGVLQFIALPMLDFKEEMTAQVKKNSKALSKLDVLTQEYSQLQAKRKALTSGTNANKGTLFAIVEKVAREQKINELIESVRPQRQELDNNLVEEKVQVRFDNLYQQDLMRFLYTVEKSLQGITVQNIEIRRTKDDLLKADLSLIMTTSKQL
ncbi:type II secretion system protein GspM [Halodesulfovibrio spirochaetisodalis]|uniref:General secretion pathway protein GspM n=1 Tax=Halodesulfovibrio spirochaetisodalis TaxID=1560234 RepID=A0A1B7XBB6_9BACT|nr:type II secretion system protein GspM [Halodesulfovibrio spirochaetisodalis]OBQ46590.1 hypothetical protein SP90_11325 [Halodesulfovibrio spirochaetisodalis]